MTLDESEAPQRVVCAHCEESGATLLLWTSWLELSDLFGTQAGVATQSLLPPAKPDPTL